MPEGPSIVILKELTAPFAGKKVLAVSGNSKVEKERADGETVIGFKSWGKHFLICFKHFTIKIHFLLFGSYRINEERNMEPRLSLKFKNGVLNFYACSVKILEGDLDKIYDWAADVMSGSWDSKAARKKLLKNSKMLVCDALLDQEYFRWFRKYYKKRSSFPYMRVHPKSKVGVLPTRKLSELIAEVRNYSFDFLEVEKAHVLRKHWLVHTKRTCPRCKIPLIKEYMGIHNRRTFFFAENVSCYMP